MFVAWSAIRSRCRTAVKSESAGSTSSGECFISATSFANDVVVVAIPPRRRARITRAAETGSAFTNASRLARSIRSVRLVIVSIRSGIGTNGGWASTTARSAMAHGQVADPLQVRGDHEHDADAAKIDGHWLVQGENLQTLVLNFVLEVVDFVVAIDDGLGGFEIAVPQGRGRGDDRIPRHSRQGARGPGAGARDRFANVWARQAPTIAMSSITYYSHENRMRKRPIARRTGQYSRLFSQFSRRGGFLDGPGEVVYHEFTCTWKLPMTETRRGPSPKPSTRREEHGPIAGRLPAKRSISAD